MHFLQIHEHEWYFEGSKELKFNAILTSYEIVVKELAILNSLSWTVLVIDEAHHLKKNAQLYRAFKRFNTSHKLLITGTPLEYSLRELWPLLHFIMPQKYVIS